MRSIAIINQKGGVGKTTTAVNLSAALAASGRRVGLVDLDPQAHASLHLGWGPQRQGPNVYEVLTGGRTLAATWQQAEEHLWIAPSHIDLAAAEVELAGVVGRELILRDALADAHCHAEVGRGVRPQQQSPDPAADRGATTAPPFDLVLIDCPPSLGILTINALAAVDDVLLPLQPHYLALHGLSKLLQTIDLVKRRLNERLRLAGVVLCLFESGTRLAAEVSADVEAFFGDVGGRQPAWRDVHLFETRIRRNIRLAEAPSFEQSIFRYAPQSAGADDYRALAAEVLALYGQQHAAAAA